MVAVQKNTSMTLEVTNSRNPNTSIATTPMSAVSAAVGAPVRGEVRPSVPPNAPSRENANSRREPPMALARHELSALKATPRVIMSADPRSHVALGEIAHQVARGRERGDAGGVGAKAHRLGAC